jgi:hypothetical protein
METDSIGNLSAGHYPVAQEEFKDEIFNKFFVESCLIQIFQDMGIKLFSGKIPAGTIRFVKKFRICRTLACKTHF